MIEAVGIDRTISSSQQTQESEYIGLWLAEEEEAEEGEEEEEEELGNRACKMASITLKKVHGPVTWVKL